MRYKNEGLAQEIVQFCKRYYFENGMSPTIREIAAGTGISVGTAMKYVAFLNDRGDIAYDGKTIRTDINDQIDNNTENVGILRTINSAESLFSETNIKGYIKLPSSLFGVGPLYLYEAKDDSLKEFDINKGDKLLLRQQENADVGDLAIIANEDVRIDIRKVYYNPKTHQYYLHTGNKGCDDVSVDFFSILGIVLYVFKAYTRNIF